LDDRLVGPGSELVQPVSAATVLLSKRISARLSTVTRFRDFSGSVTREPPWWVFLGDDNGRGRAAADDAEVYRRPAPDLMRFATALVGRVEAARRAPFDWFYQRVVGGLVADLGAERHLLRNVPLILCGGHEIYVFEETPTGCCTAQEHRRPLKVETPVRIRWGSWR
jgi:hypothetical protein